MVYGVLAGFGGFRDMWRVFVEGTRGHVVLSWGRAGHEMSSERIQGLTWLGWEIRSCNPDPREDPKSRSLKGVAIKYALVPRVPN